MIFFDLIRQQCLKMLRSKGFYKNLAVNIIMFFFAIYFSLLFVILGFALGTTLKEKSTEPVTIINGFMLYTVLGGLAFRYIMQQLGTLNYITYQTQPVKRSTLINYLVLKPLFNPLNYFTLLFASPFFFIALPATIALKYLLLFIVIIWFNTLFAAYLKRKFGMSFIGDIIVILIVAVIFALEYFKIFSLRPLSTMFFGFITSNYVFLIIPLLFVFAAYLLNKMFFARNYYLESFASKKEHGEMSFSFLNRFGMIGEIAALELKLIFRHKRTKKMIYGAIFMLIYGFCLYMNPSQKSMMGFAAFTMTGMLPAMFGQYSMGWNGAYFDGLITRNLSLRDFFTGILRMMQFAALLCFVVSSPVIFISKQVALYHIAFFLYNIGFTCSMLLYFSMWNTKRIDLNSNSAFNMQGASFMDFVVVFPLIFIPMFLPAILGIFFDYYVALIVFAAIGCICLLLDRQIIRTTVNRFNKRKYLMAAGFREKE